MIEIDLPQKFEEMLEDLDESHPTARTALLAMLTSQAINEIASLHAQAQNQQNEPVDMLVADEQGQTEARTTSE